MRRLFLLAAGAALLSGCAVGPNYKRPDVPNPPKFRGDEQQPTEKSLADTKWPELFQDARLTELVTAALQGNYDIRIAAERILQTREQYGIVRADLLPQIDVTGSFTANRPSQLGSFRFLPPGVNLDVSYTQAGFNVGWELDVWGRIRRLTEAARAEYLASEEARRGVTTTLIADVTSSYMSLRELDLELEIARKTYDIAQSGLRLTTSRRDRGVATGLDVRQAEQFVYTATAQIASSERSITQGENAVSLLLGRSPGEVARGKRLEEFIAPAEIPPGVPSSLLARRPDIRQAEATLVAANARIGAARAQYFPQISLTGFLGGQSRALSDLFIGNARQWSFVPTATFPLFNAGRIRSNVRLTEAQKREAVLTYEKTIQTAFSEVADSLVGYRKLREQREQQEKLVGTLRDTDRLSRLRYEGGLDSFLQVLDAQRSLFSGELTLAQLRREELLSVVQLYRVLGGGWQ